MAQLNEKKPSAMESITAADITFLGHYEKEDDTHLFKVTCFDRESEPFYIDSSDLEVLVTKETSAPQQLLPTNENDEFSSLQPD